MRERRIPVHVMRRFFNYLIGKCQGIEIAHRSGSALHSVSIHFDNSAEASGFYRALLAIYSDHTSDSASKDEIIHALTQLVEAQATAIGEVA